MGRFPLVFVSLAFVAAIVCARLPYAGPIAGIAACAAIVAGARARSSRIVVLIFAFGAGLADATLLHRSPDLRPDRHVRRFAAVVLATRPVEGDLVATTVRFVDGTTGSVELRGAPEAVGERLALRGRRDLFDVPRNPGEPSARDLAIERGMTWRVVRARVLARAPPDERDPSLFIPRLRAWASARVHRTFPEPEATILAGAMWGERGALAPDLRDEFQDTGTVHVLVTAGLHLGVVAAVAIAILERARCGRIGAALAAIAIVWAYAALSGDHLPSLRAATMLTFALVARAAGREATSPNALAAAALAIAALQPASVTSASFALSFSCVGAILAFAEPIASGLETIGAPPVVRACLAVAFATQLGTWPLTAATFLVIAPYAALANALVVPVVGIALLGGFASLALAPLPWLAGLVASVVSTLVDWIVAVVRFVASLPGAHVVATPPPGWTIAAYDGALVLAALALRHGRVRRATALVVCASALCLWPPRVPARDLRITAIDVGQADALLVETPAGHAYLVDAGGRLERGPPSAGASAAEEIGERVVVPFLVRRGIHHLDAILVSHPHGDHVGGVPAVLRTLGANGFADSGQTYPGHAYRDALDVARTNRVPMLEPRGGDVWRTDDGVTFRFYGPTRPYIVGSRSDINSNSLVFRLEYGRFAMLFTGDAGAETEARLLASGADLRATVLKVGHHGSAYGTTRPFLRAVAPRVAVISVGRDNLFGHPAPATILALRDAGARILRTDENGAISIRTNGTDASATPTLIP